MRSCAGCVVLSICLRGSGRLPQPAGGCSAQSGRMGRVDRMVEHMFYFVKSCALLGGGQWTQMTLEKRGEMLYSACESEERLPRFLDLPG